MILITTAGKVGAEAARLLAQREEPVRVLVRDPEKATALAQAGADVAAGDLGIPATIDAAMRGVSAIVLVSPAIPAQELNVVTSAVAAGVGHVVKITSKASADSPIARRRDQTEIENGLIASGLGYTLLRNNAYMQNFLMLAPAIAKTSSFGSSTGDGRVGMVDTRDVAAVAAQIAASPAAHQGKTYRPTGPESLSYADAAAVLSKVLGRLAHLRTIRHRPCSSLLVKLSRRCPETPPVRDWSRRTTASHRGRPVAAAWSITILVVLHNGAQALAADGQTERAAQLRAAVHQHIVRHGMRLHQTYARGSVPDGWQTEPQTASDDEPPSLETTIALFESHSYSGPRALARL